jgi:hypothetical protein
MSTATVWRSIGESATYRANYRFMGGLTGRQLLTYLGNLHGGVDV